MPIIIISLLLVTISSHSGVLIPSGVGGLVQKVILDESFAKPPEESDVGWTGMFHHFHLEQTEDVNMLRLRGNATRSDTSWLATPLSVYHGEWNYTVSITGDPSNSNRIDLVVISDTEDLKSDFNGYLLKAGENGSNDVIRLMRVEKGVMMPILSGTTSIANGGTFRVRLVREPIGRWTMYVAAPNGPFQLQGSSVDNMHGTLGYTGFRTIYTRTRNADYAVGPINIRKTQPQILHAELTGENTLRCVMDTEIDPNSPIRLTYNGQSISTRVLVKDHVVDVELDSPFLPGPNALSLSGLTTADGVFVDVSATITLVVEAIVKPGDILINEYLYHPPEDVPQFIELVNVSTNPINLKGWELRDFGSGNRSISTVDIWFNPGSYLVLTPDSLVLSTYYSAPNVRQMTRFPFLNRGSKDGIVLRTPLGETIDSLAYTPSPAGDGVSIERRSLQAPTWVPTNWKPSAHRRGATPGETNSMPPEEPATPEMDLATFIETHTLYLSFSSEIDVASLKNVSINGIPIPTMACESSNWKAVQCSSNAALPVDPDTPSFVEIEGARGLFGNTVPPMKGPISWLPTKTDIIINEIMFNPLQSRYDGGNDQSQYVELLSTRNHHLYVGDITLSTRSAVGSTASTISFSERSSDVASPRSMVILHADSTVTEDSRLSHYFGLVDSVSYFRSHRSTLSLNTVAGTVWVQSGNKQTLDSMRYDSDYHYPSVRDRRGVSLERISVGRSSLDPGNWGSHGGRLGGSPGRINSIEIGAQPTADSAITIQPNPFSPDNDGFEDITRVSLHFEESGWLTKVTIFDRYGRKVRILADGERVGNSHEIFWDGLDDNNRRAFTGFYVAVVEAWHIELRKSLSQKKVVGLIHQPRHSLSFK